MVRCPCQCPVALPSLHWVSVKRCPSPAITGRWARSPSVQKPLSSVEQEQLTNETPAPRLQITSVKTITTKEPTEDSEVYFSQIKGCPRPLRFWAPRLGSPLPVPVPLRVRHCPCCGAVLPCQTDGFRMELSGGEAKVFPLKSHFLFGCFN